MAHIHITLVGGQPTPVYQGVVLSQPDKIILICSKETKSDAEIITNKLKELHFYNVTTEIYPIDEPQVVRQKLEVLLSIFDFSEKDSISMNLSSGVKLWSLICLDICPRANSHAYCLSQNGKVLNIIGQSPKSKVEFDMFTQFVLLGNGLSSYSIFSDYCEQEKENHEILKQLYKNSTFQKLLKLLKLKVSSEAPQSKDLQNWLKSDRFVEMENDEEKYIEWHAKEKVFSISLGNQNNQYYEIKGEYASQMLLNTAWFEYEVAEKMAEIYGAQNVYMNCRFLSQEEKDKNEVDVIVNTGQKLLFVECKTQIFKPTDIDKFHSVVQNYGGTGSKSLFITMHQMNAIQQEKCNDNQIATFYLYEKDNIARSTKSLANAILEFINVANK